MNRILFYVISVLTIIINIIFVLIGVFFYLEGNLIIAITIWILVAIEKVVVIYLLVKLLEYYGNIADPPDGVLVFPDPTCLIFIGIIIAATLMISLINYSIL